MNIKMPAHLIIQHQQMRSCSEMIKISHKHKTFLIEKPNSFSNLKDFFRLKFNVSNFANKEIIANDNIEDIFITDDDDLSNLLVYIPEMPKIILKEEPKRKANTKIAPMNIRNYLSCLQGNLAEGVEETAGFVKKGLLPCRHCFFGTRSFLNKKNKEESRYCHICKNTKTIPINQNWDFVMSLLDAKIGRTLLNPFYFSEKHKAGGFIKNFNFGKKFANSHFYKSPSLGQVTGSSQRSKVALQAGKDL